jgi:CubicO group peptidase (beta-lactamase class C family)
MGSHFFDPGGLALAAALAAVPAAAGAQSTRPLDRADLEAWLDGVVPVALDRADIAGLAVVVVRDGRVLLEKGYGFADLARRLPIDPERTVFPVASVSKTFAWTAVMQLVQRGRLDLDRDIAPELGFQLAAAFGRPITLRQLMTHTAGFEERIRSTIRPGEPPRSLRAYLETIPSPDRIYPPGTVQAYSNYGADLAGYIVERASGEPFPEYVRRHILLPAGMTRTTFVRPVPSDLAADLAAGYDTRSAAVPLPPSANPEEIAGGPAGDLVATPADIGRYMLAHLGRGEWAGRLLDSATAERMHAGAFTPVPGGHATALGFFSADRNGHRVIGHDGDATGYHADMQLLIDDGVGFFTVVNSDGSGGLIGASYGLRVRLFHQFMDRYFPGPPEPDEPTLSTARDHARLVAGEYEMSRRPDGDFMRALYLAARIRIRALDDGTIETPALLNFEQGRPGRWREVAPFSWRSVDGPERLDMKVENGRVVTWLPRDLSTFQLLPVPAWRSARINLPLLVGSAVVLLLASLGWLVATVQRRRAWPAPGKAVRIAGSIGLLYLGCWAALLLAVAAGITGFDPRLDPWIRAVQLVGLGTVAAAVVSLWATAKLVTRPAPTGIRLFAIAITLALADVVWFSFVFTLISPRLNY